MPISGGIPPLEPLPNLCPSVKQASAELKFHFGTTREREIYSVSPQAERMREQSDQNANPWFTPLCPHFRSIATLSPFAPFALNSDPPSLFHNPCCVRVDDYI
jgi:hypothetical protein